MNAFIGRVSVNAQMDVFISVKHVQDVQKIQRDAVSNGLGPKLLVMTLVYVLFLG